MQQPVFSSTFTFAPGQYDEEFHELDAKIAMLARSIPGYLGEETWTNADTGLISNVYYWRSEEALRQLMQHPAHVEAKKKQAGWLNGYHVVIAQVIRSSGDGRIGHPLAQVDDTPPAQLCIE